jgi:hypothetical protein
MPATASPLWIASTTTIPTYRIDDDDLDDVAQRANMPIRPYALVDVRHCTRVDAARQRW